MDPHLFKRFCVMHNLCDMQHRFGGDTANVETGASKILLLNDCDFCSKLCGSDGGYIATRARTYYCYVIMCTCHTFSPCHAERSEASTTPLHHSVRMPYFFFC